MLPLKLIAAIDSKGGIAKAGGIPWSLPGDMKYFREMTRHSNILMGWETFVQIGKVALPDRHNIILTRRHVTLQQDCEVIHNLEQFLNRFREDLWVVGGQDLFTQTMQYATHLYITRIEHDFGCDKFFPEYENTFELLMHSPTLQENGLRYRFEVWVRQ